MTNQTTKRCHWVSQSYLRAFAADPDKRAKIWRFSKHAGDPELKPIDKVAVKFHLYAPRGPDGRRDDALEKKLSSLEKWFGDPIWAAVCNDFPDYSWEPLRKMMALLVATTYLRNPKQLEHWKAVHRQMRDAFSQLDQLPSAVTIGDKRVALDPSTWPAYRDATEEDLKASWNDYIGGAAGVAQTFLKMRWAVVVSETPVFITSDNPVLVGDTVSPFRGMKHPDTMVTFPLSPTRILMMDNRHSEPDARYYPLQGGPGAFNNLIWRNAIDHMFTPRHPDEVIGEMMAEAEEMGFA